ncbi:MAG: hypothetical protein KME20_01280 [Kaiparowitsia implicata GSE-PSE-MK54-09C]|jgi:hypothetical protein|nr:hypothetical protein [Kaiparowitsia implicata GSE-PSE-MK54-09C]
MVKTFTKGFSMLLQLSDSDLAQMPPNLSSALVRWLQDGQFKSAIPSQSRKPQLKTDIEQLALTLVDLEKTKQTSKSFSKSVISDQDSVPREKLASHCHIRLTQLFAAGITKSGMPIRVRLKQELAKKRGHDYVTKGLSISSKGRVDSL